MSSMLDGMVAITKVWLQQHAIYFEVKQDGDHLYIITTRSYFTFNYTFMTAFVRGVRVKTTEELRTELKRGLQDENRGD